MPSQQTADVVVIGAGPAGYVCAIRLAQLGRKVTVIEKGNVGGVCLNVGCIPSKAMIHAASTVDRIRHASVMGIDAGEPKVQIKKLIEWKDSVVKKLTGGVSGLLKANGCMVMAGEARFLGPRQLEVKTTSGTTVLEFQHCVIATGSRPAQIPSLTVDQKIVWDSTGALAPEQIPQTLLCIGGGYIGLELGTVYAKLGTRVTVVEAASQLLGGVDPALSQVVIKRLKQLGVSVRPSTRVTPIRTTTQGVTVEFDENGKKTQETFEKVLVTVGRKPNTEDLGLEKAGLKTNAQGFLEVDVRRQTIVPGIWAIGDCAGQPLLAHKGSKEGVVCAEAIGGLSTVYDVVAIPAVIFTDPEIATVGMTESEARSAGFDLEIGTFPFAANGRALSVNESDGMVKIVGDRKTGRLLGVHIVGAEASNLISEAALALEMGAQVSDLAWTVHPHPTLPETLMEAAEATLGHAIHIYQKPKTSGLGPEAHV